MIPSASHSLKSMKCPLQPSQATYCKRHWSLMPNRRCMSHPEIQWGSHLTFMFPVPAIVFTKRKLNKYKVSFHKLGPPRYYVILCYFVAISTHINPYKPMNSHPLTTVIFRIRLHGLMASSPASWRGTAQIVEEMTLGEALGRSTIPRVLSIFWGCYNPSI